MPGPRTSIPPAGTIDTAGAPTPTIDCQRRRNDNSRRAGTKTIAEGIVIAVAGIAGLWISFWLGDSAKTILGAGPLIGGGMIGYGGVQLLLGPSLRPLRWMVAIPSGVLLVGVTIILLETTLGVTFA